MLFDVGIEVSTQVLHFLFKHHLLRDLTSPQQLAFTRFRSMTLLGMQALIPARARIYRIRLNIPPSELQHRPMLELQLPTRLAARRPANPSTLLRTT